MTIKLRPYQEADSDAVGKLIATTFREFNLSFLPPDEQGAYLGPLIFRLNGNNPSKRIYPGCAEGGALRAKISNGSQ